MQQTIRAVFDGQVLRPQDPVDLEPNVTYVVIIENERPARTDSEEEPYPLTEIGRLATDMGVTDLAERHKMCVCISWQPWQP
jgi:hypothetical protein